MHVSQMPSQAQPSNVGATVNSAASGIADDVDEMAHEAGPG